MASVSLCDPCQGQDKHVTGIQWCPDCEVNLCSDCVSYHKSLKTTKDHDLADINAPFNAAAEISKQQCCNRHAELKVEYFCTAHDELCCHACLVETHRSCDKVVALDIVCKSASSRILDDPNNEIKFIGKTLKSIDEEMKLNLSTLKVENTGIKKKIAEAKAKAISRINENEANLRTELKKREGQSLTKIYEIIAKTKSMADQLEHQVNKIHFVQQHGTNKQAFILFHRLKTFLAEVNKSVLDLPSSTTTLTMDFEENNELISLLPTLGEISISEKFIPVKITQFKQLSAQCANLHASKPFTSYIKISQFSTSDEVNISGMISTTDGKLLMCDYCFSSGVLVYSENGQYIQTITTNSRPFDIAEIPGRNQYVVTLPHIRHIQFIDGVQLTPGECIQIDQQKTFASTYIYGAAASNRNIYIGDNNLVHVLTVEGSYTRTVSLDGFGMAHYLLYKGGYLYACVDNFILCIYQNDVIPSLRIEEPAIMRKPIADSRGYFYVGGFDTGKVHRLTKDLIPDMTIVDDNIQQVAAICFNRDCTKLYVASGSGEEILSFSCT